MAMHGSLVLIQPRVRRFRTPAVLPVWLYRRGWEGHAPKELARRRAAFKAARRARRRNRG